MDHYGRSSGTRLTIAHELCALLSRTQFLSASLTVLSCLVRGSKGPAVLCQAKVRCPVNADSTLHAAAGNA